MGVSRGKIRNETIKITARKPVFPLVALNAAWGLLPHCLIFASDHPSY
jgi:hypothetical protein